MRVAGRSCVCRSRTICSRCSSRRRNRYASASASASDCATYPSSASVASARSVFGSRRSGSRRPCTICKQLHRELHVADAAATALHLGQLLAAPPDVLLQADLGAADVVDRARLELVRIDERRHAGDERRADPRIARHRTRLDHRLPLPRGRPVLVVLERRLEAARQHAAASAGTKRRVHAERDALGGGLGEERDQRRRRRARQHPAASEPPSACTKSRSTSLA